MFKYLYKLLCCSTASTIDSVIDQSENNDAASAASTINSHQNAAQTSARPQGLSGTAQFLGSQPSLQRAAPDINIPNYQEIRDAVTQRTESYKTFVHQNADSAVALLKLLMAGLNQLAFLYCITHIRVESGFNMARTGLDQGTNWTNNIIENIIKNYLIPYTDRTIDTYRDYTLRFYYQIPANTQQIQNETPQEEEKEDESMFQTHELVPFRGNFACRCDIHSSRSQKPW